MVQKSYNDLESVKKCLGNMKKKKFNGTKFEQ